MGFPADVIAIAMSAIGCLIWLVRLEGRVLGALEKIKDLSLIVSEQSKKHDALDERIMEKLSFIERSLAKIEGQLITRRNDHGE